MKKFLGKFLLFCAVILCLYFSIGIFNKHPATKSDYLAEMIDKHRRLDSIKSPALILGGGSNLAFGLDTRKLEETFGVPVVNLGLNGGLGLKFILNELKYSIKRNDIVILSIEYFISEKGVYGLKRNASGHFPEANRYYPWDPLAAIETSLNKNRDILKALYTKKDGEGQGQQKDTGIAVYSREAFNSYGDEFAHLNRAGWKNLIDGKTFSYAYWDGIASINDFCDYAEKMGVHVFYSYPPYPTSEYENNKKVIGLLDTDLKNDLKAPILNEPTDLVYPDSLFYDTIYHLGKIGREKRTAEMIELIEKNKSIMQWITSVAKTGTAKAETGHH